MDLESVAVTLSLVNEGLVRRARRLDSAIQVNYSISLSAASFLAAAQLQNNITASLAATSPAALTSILNLKLTQLNAPYSVQVVSVAFAGASTTGSPSSTVAGASGSSSSSDPVTVTAVVLLSTLIPLLVILTVVAFGWRRLRHRGAAKAKSDVDDAGPSNHKRQIMAGAPDSPSGMPALEILPDVEPHDALGVNQADQPVADDAHVAEPSEALQPSRSMSPRHAGMVSFV